MVGYYNPQAGGGSPAQMSKYHSSFQKIDRLDESWKRCRTLWRGGQLESLNYELDAIWMELEADSSVDERNTFLELSKKIETAISLQKRQTHPRKINFVGGVLARLLKKKWTHLFRVEKGQGLGKKYQEDYGDIF